MQAHGPEGEVHHNQVQATYELVLEYGMEVPAMDMAAYQTLTADMNALHQVMEDVETRQEEQTEAFGRELANGASTLLNPHCHKHLPCSMHML